MSVLESLEASSIGVFVRESTYGFAIVVACHLLSLMCSVGVIIWFDLRLLGVVMTEQPVSTVYRRLIPLASIGFVVAVLSGLALVMGYATAAYGNVFFRLKIAALCLAALNAVVFHWLTARQQFVWDRERSLPASARLAGLCSLLLWAAIVLLGRSMSYTMF